MLLASSLEGWIDGVGVDAWNFSFFNGQNGKSIKGKWRWRKQSEREWGNKNGRERKGLLSLFGQRRGQGIFEGTGGGWGRYGSLAI